MFDDVGLSATRLSLSGADERTKSGFVVACVGGVVALSLFTFFYREQSLGRGAPSLALPTVNLSDMDRYWAYPVQEASGLSGLLFAWIAALLGLQQSGRALAWTRMSYKQVDRLHRQVSLLVLTLVGIHVLTTSLDAVGDNWRTVLLINQMSALGFPQANWGYNAGVLAMYTLVIVAPTFYVRRMIGANRWRMLHRFVLVAYVLAVWHSLILGLDVGHYAWIKPTIWLMQIPLLGMLVRRILRPARTGEAQRGRTKPLAALRYSLVAVSLAGIVAIAAVVVTGNSGFVATV